MIPRFVKQYPDVRVHINLSDSKVDLLHGTFDAAFWVGEPYDSALEAVKLREFEMVLAGAPEYFRRRRKPTTPTEFKEHDCIIETHLSRPGEWRLSNDQTISVGRGPLTLEQCADDARGYPRGMGIAFLPRFIVAEDIAEKRLIAILTDYVSARLPLYIMFPNGHYVLAKVKAFVDYLSASIGGQSGPKAVDFAAKSEPNRHHLIALGAGAGSTGSAARAVWAAPVLRSGLVPQWQLHRPVG